jgi:hypothetical protein
VTDQEKEEMIDDTRPMASLTWRVSYDGAAERRFSYGRVTLKAFLESHNIWNKNPDNRFQLSNVMTMLEAETMTRNSVIFNPESR